MPASSPLRNEFLTKLTSVIETHLSDEQFGVSELARKMGMSRSNLLRKVKSQAKISVSQFIKQVRLERSMELLNQNSYTVSEVSYLVGFSSVSYFVKCFHDHYGYPPGEAGKRLNQEVEVPEVDQSGRKSRKKQSRLIIGISIAVGALALIAFILIIPALSGRSALEKSIAVLPFKNDSNDSTNVYIINGLMESILDNLQQIEDLRVISRTSVEKFRNNPKTIPEIARELDVNYFVEGSGQKIGGQILLSVQLIEARGDRHLWSAQYNREAGDIFQLQREVAKSIADEIKAVITPEEEERINKLPTRDLVAYDYFLKGLDLFYQETREGLLGAISYFEKAVEHDPEFARAYADMAISFALLDFYLVEKKNSGMVKKYAGKALSIDPKLAQSLIAQALYYMNYGEKEMAIPYLEKALQYNPNSAMVLNILADFYINQVRDLGKYLEYALMGISLDIAAQDSTGASYTYMHLGNAFMQLGFIEEAETCIDKSLEYNPGNLYSEYIRAYILYGKNRDLEQTKGLLIRALNRDMTRIDIVQEIAKVCYYLRDYEGAYTYYRKLIEIREAQNLDLYKFENAKIGLVLSENGMPEEAQRYFQMYRNDVENDESIYRDLSLAAYDAYMGETVAALEHLELFTRQPYYNYLLVPFLRLDPLFENIKERPEFKEILSSMEAKFWIYHEEIKRSLEEKELL